jgi:hypothetical protein
VANTPETRIVLKRLPDNRVSISCVDPVSERLVDTGHTAGPDPRDVDRQVHALKNQLERAGNRVTVTGP